MIENRKRGAASNNRRHIWPIVNGKHEIPYYIGRGNLTSKSNEAICPGLGPITVHTLQISNVTMHRIVSHCTINRPTLSFCCQLFVFTTLIYIWLRTLTKPP